MPDIVDRTVPSLEPLRQGVLDDALVVSADRANHDALAARVPALREIAVGPAPSVLPVPRRLRIAAWNVERLKRVDAVADLLATADADIALLSEVDLGMARSGNRDTAAELARLRDAGYAYGVEFVELGLGDVREARWHAGERNHAGFHGNAIVSRFRLADPFVVRLDEGGLWFGAGGAPDQRRLGGRMALAARLADAPHPLWVVVAHLENRSDPATRAAQMGWLLAALAKRIGTDACVVGGDLNTLALPRGDGLPPDIARDPSAIEPLFGAMRQAGFGWAEANTAHVTSRTRPDGAPLPPFTRIDWLFTRGVAPHDPATLPALDRAGVAISDHDAISVGIDFAP